jgi:hypothetical protein
MEKNNKKFSNQLLNLEPSPELFDRIILAIRKEKELRKTKRLLFGFLFLSIFSISIMPFSCKMFINQMRKAGIFYFVSTAVSNLAIFLNFWQDFIFAILESLPIVEIIFFATNLIIFLFAIHLFLSRKRLLLAYLIQK